MPTGNEQSCENDDRDYERETTDYEKNDGPKARRWHVAQLGGSGGWCWRLRWAGYVSADRKLSRRLLAHGYWTIGSTRAGASSSEGKVLRSSAIGSLPARHFHRY